MNTVNIHAAGEAAGITANGEHINPVSEVAIPTPEPNDNAIIQSENETKLNQDLEAQRIYQEEMQAKNNAKLDPNTPMQEVQAYQQQLSNMAVLDPFSQQQMNSNANDLGIGQNLQNALLMAG